MPLPITATIITLNEELQIGDCIRNLQQICDEIIVVDSLSTDRTVEIAESLGAKIVKQAYLGDGPQKAYGVPHAKNDWILSMDADERISDELQASIEQLDLNNNDIDCYRFNRKTYIGDIWVKCWYPDYLVRLYNKHTAAYTPITLHSAVEGKQVKTIAGDIIHYSYQNWGDVIGKIRQYATLGARTADEKGRKASALSPISHGIGAFIKMYLFKKGMLHGMTGLNIALVSAFSSYMKWVILREMQQKKTDK